MVVLMTDTHLTHGCRDVCHNELVDRPERNVASSTQFGLILNKVSWNNQPSEALAPENFGAHSSGEVVKNSTVIVCSLLLGSILSSNPAFFFTGHSV